MIIFDLNFHATRTISLSTCCPESDGVVIAIYNGVLKTATYYPDLGAQHVWFQLQPGDTFSLHILHPGHNGEVPTDSAVYRVLEVGTTLSPFTSKLVPTYLIQVERQDDNIQIKNNRYVHFVR